MARGESTWTNLMQAALCTNPQEAWMIRTDRATKSLRRSSSKGHTDGENEGGGWE